MNEINRVSTKGVARGGATKKNSRSRQSDNSPIDKVFTDHLETSEAQEENLQPINETLETTSIASLLTLQEDNRKSSNNNEREAMVWGKRTLQFLNDLKNNMLVGQVNLANLNGILTVAKNKQKLSTLGSPLQKVLLDIETRVRVEIAKRS